MGPSRGTPRRPWRALALSALVALPVTARPAVAMTATESAPSAPPIDPSIATAPPFAPLAFAQPLAGAAAFPARAYGDLRGAACLKALGDRAVPFVRLGRQRGVETPVRLTGPLHGVAFRSDADPEEKSARREVYDCRLLLALDDLARVASQRGVTEVRHFGVYRDDVPLPAHGRPRHHVAALAIDVAAFLTADGARLDVRRDFGGRIGRAPCGGPASGRGATADLRRILCDVVAERSFHQVLTPNHDARHGDHFHLEVMRQTSWTLVE